MAQLNAIQQSIITSIENFKSGSRGVVVSFETVLQDYWGASSCNPNNIQFFLNALKSFPVLQASAKKLLPRFGNFSIKLDNDNTSPDKSKKQYIVTNLDTIKENGEKVKIAKRHKDAYRAEVEKFVACEHTSLLHDKQVKSVALNAFEFDADKSQKAIESAIKKQILDLLKANPDSGADAIRNIVNNTVAEVMKPENIKPLREKAREQIAERKELQEKCNKAGLPDRNVSEVTPVTQVA